MDLPRHPSPSLSFLLLIRSLMEGPNKYAELLPAGIQIANFSRRWWNFIVAPMQKFGDWKEHGGKTSLLS